MTLGCVIMAAGGSSRFGGNKLLQTLQGAPLFRRALDAVPPQVFAAVTVVTGYEAVASEARARGFSVVRNDQPQLGISRTVRLGLQTLTHCDGVLFMTADQPFLTADTVKKLAQTFAVGGDSIVAAAHNGQRGNPCLFPAVCFPALLQLQGDRGGGSVIGRCGCPLVTVEVPALELADADTPQALETLRRSGHGGF